MSEKPGNAEEEYLLRKAIEKELDQTKDALQGVVDDRNALDVACSHLRGKVDQARLQVHRWRTMHEFLQASCLMVCAGEATMKPHDDGEQVVFTIVDKDKADDLVCIHGRKRDQMCPHCLGFATDKETDDAT